MSLAADNPEPEIAAAGDAATRLEVVAPLGSVRLTGATKRYGDLVALDAIDLDVKAGEFLSILGPSGSGKTTTMRLIGGFEQPDAAAFEISGVDVAGLPPFKRDVNTVFQSYALFPNMSVIDNVAYGLRMKGVRKKERLAKAAEMLEMVQLAQAADRRPGQLSGGMKQRVALARALVNRPSVLLLDEPLGALDRKLREDMQVELRRIQSTVGITFVYVTHYQEEALSMSDRLVVMRNGRIEQIGSPAEIYDAPSTLWVAGFVGHSSSMEGRSSSKWRARRHRHALRPDRRRPPPRSDGSGWARHGHRAPGGHRPGLGASGAWHAQPLQVVVEELLNIGHNVKVVAKQSDGTQIMAHVRRADAAALALLPGATTWLTFEASSVHAYPPAGPEA